MSFCFSPYRGDEGVRRDDRYRYDDRYRHDDRYRRHDDDHHHGSGPRKRKRWFEVLKAVID